ncbi:MAG: prepilin-type N-terminal cleavage/methylation domain-containing protein [Deltaproteobacteria bacterium]|nr:prepilin-type N-terminal cleavage/methylation domain-containing protein [Deltaproteobacteria bacterium]
MKPATTTNPDQHRSRCDAGFTLIEIIISLIVAGILASIAGMGIVSAFSSYSVVRENVALSQKIQLAATRIQRELLELTDIGFQDNARPYIAYYSADGQPRAIAKVDDTIRLYNDLEGPISDADLENNGDILTDGVESFTLNYFQGSNVWNGADIRELSTIQFSLNLLRHDVAGSTVNATTLVHLRNNDNYGGSAVNLPVAPPTGGQYSCFISTVLPGSVGFDSPRIRALMRWILIMIPLLWVVRCIKHTNRVTPAKPNTPFSNKTDGSALIGIIIAILVFAALGAAIVPMISSSQLHRTAAGRSAQAYYLAESGMRYAASQYLNATGEAAKYAALNDLHGFPYQLQENQGTFTVSANPYYFSVVGDHTNTTTLVARFYGGLAPGYTFPDAGRLSIEDTIYSFSAAPVVNLAGQQITFVLSPVLTVAADTPVYPVAQVPSGQTVSDGGNLSLSPGSGDMFPDRNGSFELGGTAYTYRENNRDTDTLAGIKRNDSLGFSDIPLTVDEEIRLKKFVKITSTGTVGSGDMMASRDIVYHVQIPEEKEAQRITFYEKFDNLDKWNPSVLGSHVIADIGGNNVLRVVGITQYSVDTPSASLIALNTDAVQFNPDRFDVQVKIGYVETPSPPTHGYDPLPIPKYYSAGLCFRLYGNTNTYGLSFQRGNTSASPPDNIENGLIPVNDMHAIVLWQATNNGADKVWLAYKQISDVNLDSSAQEISEAQWVDTSGRKYSEAITDLTAIPELPCDYRAVKLRLSSTCDPLQADCTTLEVSIDGGAVWIPMQSNEADLTSFAGQAITTIQFRINTGTIGWHIFNVGFTADNFDVENATLLSRFKASASITFDTGGSDFIEPGDRIIGRDSGAVGTVYGSPILVNDNWTTDDAAGTLLLENVNGVFNINERLIVAGKSDIARITGFRAQDRYIKAYYGTASGCGTPNTDPLDGEKRPYPIDPPELNWPPDEGDPWTADKDYFQLIQWDAINSAVGTVDRVDSLDQPNTLIRSSEAALTGLGSTLGLHTFGKGSLNVYFDDFGYQSFVDQPVAISQPIQY